MLGVLFAFYFIGMGAVTAVTPASNTTSALWREDNPYQHLLVSFLIGWIIIPIVIAKSLILKLLRH